MTSKEAQCDETRWNYADEGAERTSIFWKHIYSIHSSDAARGMSPCQFVHHFGQDWNITIICKGKSLIQTSSIWP